MSPRNLRFGFVLVSGKGSAVLDQVWLAALTSVRTHARTHARTYGRGCIVKSEARKSLLLAIVLGVNLNLQSEKGT